jgi:hypothetical protein
MTLKDIVADPNLYKLASGEVLPDMKHPGLGTGQPVLQKESSPPKPLPPPPTPPIGTKPATPSQPTTGAKPVSGQPQRTKKGDKGAAVVAWQKFLLSKGYDLGPSGADGDHGNATEKASLDWESKGGKGSAAGTAGGFPDLGIALVVVVAGVGAGWLGYDFMESRK